MTDKEALLAYRLREAEETLADARKILGSGLTFGHSHRKEGGGVPEKLKFRPRRRFQPKKRFFASDAVVCHFDPDRMPKMIRLHFVHEEVLAV